MPFRLVPRFRKPVIIAVPAFAGLLLAAVGMAVVLALYSEPVTFDTVRAAGIQCSVASAVVPGQGVPPDLSLRSANNNCDMAYLDGRLYLVFRTAPTHFASPNTRLIVLSTVDRVTWKREAEFALGADLREPRLLAYKERLFLYFFEAGVHPLRFEPKRLLASARERDGSWTAPQEAFKPGYVPWRVREHGGKAYMSVYYGHKIYGKGSISTDIRLLTSEDGLNWAPISDAPQLDWVGAEEPEFNFDEEGNLVALVRLEVGCASLLCTAPKDDLTKWTAHRSPHKYDSSLMFARGKEMYVIARRNVAGPADRGWNLPPTLNNAVNLVMYSMTRKRTSLYRIDLEARALVPLFDLPSRGDTAFAAVVPLSDKSYFVVNYSNRLDGPDLPWYLGQLSPTLLYACTLDFK